MMLSELRWSWCLRASCSLDDALVSAARQSSPPECEVRGRADVLRPCLVEQGRVATTEGSEDAMTTESRSGQEWPDQELSAIMSERRRLIGLAYRLLGSLAEAEDAVQETYARWYALSRPDQEAIESPGAWLTTVASRICLNLLGSARARRETYVGEWLPEPLPGQSEWMGGPP